MEQPLTEQPKKASADTLDDILDGAGELAALPQIVMRVIDMTADPKAIPADLERVIGMDQALAAKLLTLANSSYYGLPRRISSLREAVVFLGFKTLRNMAMTITTFNLFLGRADADSLIRRAIWRHSVDAAQCAKVITALLPPGDPGGSRHGPGVHRGAAARHRENDARYQPPRTFLPRLSAWRQRKGSATRL